LGFFPRAPSRWFRSKRPTSSAHSTRFCPIWPSRRAVKDFGPSLAGCNRFKPKKKRHNSHRSSFSAVLSPPEPCFNCGGLAFRDRPIAAFSLLAYPVAMQLKALPAKQLSRQDMVVSLAKELTRRAGKQIGGLAAYSAVNHPSRNACQIKTKALRLLSPSHGSELAPVWVFSARDGTVSAELWRPQWRELKAAFDIRCLSIPHDDLTGWETALIQADRPNLISRKRNGSPSRPSIFCGESFLRLFALETGCTFPRTM